MRLGVVPLSVPLVPGESAAGLEVADRDLQAGLGSRLREFGLPQPQAVPATGAGLDVIETGILDALDPALNLDKRPKNELRTRLSALRRRHNQR